MSSDDDVKAAERNFVIQFFSMLTAVVTDRRILAALVAVGVTWASWITSKAGDIQPHANGIANDPCYVTGANVNNANQQACIAILCALPGISCHPGQPPTPVPVPVPVVDAGVPTDAPFVQPSCNPPTLKGPDPRMLDEFKRSLRPFHKVSSFGSLMGIGEAATTRDVGWRSNLAFCGNQKSLGACEAFTQLDIATAQPRSLYFATQSAFNAAAVKAYSWITANDGIDGAYPPDDTGSDSLTGCKWLVVNGYAKSCQVLTGANAVKVAIQSGPVISGMNWPDKFMRPDRCGNMTIGGPIDGGHAVGIFEYHAGLNGSDDSWVLLNHWDQSWGVCIGKVCGYFILTSKQLFGPDLDADFVQPVL